MWRWRPERRAGLRATQEMPTRTVVTFAPQVLPALEPHDGQPSRVPRLSRIGLREDRENAQKERDTAMADGFAEDRANVRGLPPERLEERHTAGRSELEGRVVEMRAHALLHEAKDRGRRDIEHPPVHGGLCQEVATDR